MRASLTQAFEGMLAADGATRPVSNHDLYIEIADAKFLRRIDSVEQLPIRVVPKLKFKAGDTVIVWTYNAELLCGQLTMLWKGCGPDKARVVSGPRILNINVSQVVGAIRRAQ